MTQILKVKTVQAVAWKTLIEALSQMLADAPLEFTPKKEVKIKKFIEKKVNGKMVKEEVVVTETSKEEHQDQAREIDHQKKKEDPNYKGAFHDKKRKSKSKNKRSSRSKGRRR